VMSTTPDVEGWTVDTTAWPRLGRLAAAAASENGCSRRIVSSTSSSSRDSSKNNASVGCVWRSREDELVYVLAGAEPPWRKKCRFSFYVRNWRTSKVVCP
jgi:hypothetical protein